MGINRQPARPAFSHWRTIMRSGTALSATLARLLPAGTVAVVAGAASLPFPDQARAQTATWIGGISSDFDTAANWNPAAVPNNNSVTIVFGPTGNATVAAGGGNASAFEFTAGAPSYTIMIGPAATGFGIHGDGIVNNSGVLQTINIGGPTVGPGLIFWSNASIGANVVLNVTGEGQIDFNDSSTGGLAAFNLNGNRGMVITGDNHAVSLGSLGGSSSSSRVQFSGYNQSLTIGGNNESTTYAGYFTESAGSGSLTKVGSGTLTLSRNSNYSGGTTIAGGTLSVSSNSNLGATSGSLTFDGGTLQVRGTTFNSTGRTINWGAGGGGFDIADAANTFTVVQTLTGAGSLTKSGAGTLVLLGNNAYSGGTTISGGTLQMSHANALGTGDVQINAGGALRSTVDATLAAPELRFSGAGTSVLSAATGTVLPTVLTVGNYVDFAPNNIVQYGTATDTGTIVFAPTSFIIDDTSATVVAGGILRDGNGGLAHVTAWQNSTTVAAGATLDFNGFAADDPSQNAGGIRNLQGAGTVQIGTDAASVLNIASGAFNGGITGAGGVRIQNLSGTNNGTLVLGGTGLNTYTGATTINAGHTLRASAANAFAANSTHQVALGAVLDLGGLDQTIGGLAGAGAVHLGAGTLTTGGNNADTDFSGSIDGGGGLTKTGTGTLSLYGTNSYAGATTVSQGWVRLYGAGTLGTGPLALNGTSADPVQVQFWNTTSAGALAISIANPDNALSFGDTASAGSATINNGGQLWFLDNATAGNAVITNTATGFTRFFGSPTADNATIINNAGGQVDISGLASAGIGIGSLSGDGAVYLAGKTLTIGGLGTNDAIGGVIQDGGYLGGTGGSLAKIGAGTLTLSGSNTYTGATTVSAGTLLVNGSIASSSLTTVAAGATLGGSGTVGTTEVYGTLSAGNSPGMLTVAGNLTLQAGSTSIFQFGTPGVAGGASNDLVTVTGDLALDGALQTPGAVSGYYRLFDVGGAVSGAFAAAPAGATVSADIPHQVNLLLNQGGQLVQFWDGVDQTGNGTVDGGTGTWSATNTNWTGAPGQAGINDRWRGEVGVFSATAGVVTTAGPLSFQGLQFKTDGYRLEGDALTMTGDAHGNAAASFVNVDGGVTATIAASLTGAGIGLDKLGGGTLVLAGASNYSGATTVAAGTLQAGAANVFAVGSVHEVAAGATLDLNSFDQEVRALSGAGRVALGGGTLTVGGVDASSIFAGSIDGSGSLSKIGTGTFTLAGTSSYTGPTQVFSGGALQAGAVNAFSAASTHEVNFGATLDLNDFDQTVGGLIGAGTVKLGSGALTTGGNNASTSFNGSIEGAGSLVKVGSGFFGLLTAGSWSGGLVAREGHVGIGHDQALGTGTLTLDGGTVQATIDGLALANAIQATGNGGDIDNAGHTLTLNGVIGGGDISFTSSGGPGSSVRTVVTADNSGWSGHAMIVGAGVAVTHDRALGTGAIELDNGRLIAGAADLRLANEIKLQPNANIIDNDGNRFALAGGLGNAPGQLGSVSFSGSGTTVLEGASNYTGATTVAAGTLQAGAAKVLAAGSAHEVAAGATLDLNSFDQEVRALTGTGRVALGGGTLTVGGVDTSSTFAGSIDGSGGLFKIGTGTLTLAGTSSYTGITAVYPGGVLQAGAANAFSAASLHEVSAGATLDLNDFDQTVGGVIGHGAVKLGGAVLTVGANDASATFDGGIEGAGSLVKIGSGNFNLQTAGSWSGGLVVKEGHVGIGHNQALGTGALTLDGGTVQAAADGLAIANAIHVAGNDGTIANAGYTLTLNGAISGSGEISFTSSGGSGPGGRTILTADNSGWSGDAVIFGTGVAVAHDNALGTGTVELDDGGLIAAAAGLRLANAIALQSNDNVIDNGSYRFTLAGAFGNAASGQGGSVVFGGSGTTVLEGASSYTGATRVRAGTLAVNGSIASSALTTVEAGATLGGNGTVGNTLIDGGTLSPGNSIGTLTVAGNLVLTAAATYMVEVSPAGADFTRVTGAATLGGATVQARFAAGSYVEKRYTILTASGGVTGAFAGPVNTNLPTSFKSALATDANNVYLDLTLAFRQDGLNANQRNVANTLVNFFNSAGGIPLAFSALDPRGLSLASGEIATTAAQAAFDAQSQFLNALTGPFAAGGATAPSQPPLGYAATGREGKPHDAFAAMTTKAPPMRTFEQRWRVFGAAYGGSTEIGGNAALGSHDATSRVYGAMGGAAYALSPATQVGFALGGGGTSFSLSDGFGSGRSDLFQAGVFAHHGFAGNGYLSAAFAYGWHDVTTDRVVLTGERLRGAYKAGVLSGRVEAGWRIDTAFAGVTPYAAAQTISYRMPSYLEQGNGAIDSFALGYAGHDVTATRSELGLRLDRATVMGDTVLTLRGRAAWAHNFDTARDTAATFQALPGTGFIVNGAAMAPDAALVSAGAEIAWRNGLSFAASFEGEFSDNVTSYAGKGTIRYAW